MGATLCRLPAGPGPSPGALCLIAQKWLLFGNAEIQMKCCLHETEELIRQVSFQLLYPSWVSVIWKLFLCQVQQELSLGSGVICRALHLWETTSFPLCHTLAFRKLLLEFSCSQNTILKKPCAAQQEEQMEGKSTEVWPSNSQRIKEKGSRYNDDAMLEASDKL